MKIEVTQKHIDEGIQGNPYNCAIARAIREATGIDARVRAFSVQTMYGEAAIQGAFRDLLADFVSKFDTSKTLVRPFSFEMEISPIQRWNMYPMPEYAKVSFASSMLIPDYIA